MSFMDARTKLRRLSMKEREIGSSLVPRVPSLMVTALTFSRPRLNDGGAPMKAHCRIHET
jgi:hypothetical protein